MTEIINAIQPQEFVNKTVCIIKFNMPLTGIDISPGKYFQVTIDPGKISQSGKFIRFGNNPGDELVGWQPVDWITVAEVLGEWVDDNPPTLEYKTQDGITMIATPAQIAEAR